MKPGLALLMAIRCIMRNSLIDSYLDVCWRKRLRACINISSISANGHALESQFDRLEHRCYHLWILRKFGEGRKSLMLNIMQQVNGMNAPFGGGVSTVAEGPMV